MLPSILAYACLSLLCTPAEGQTVGTAHIFQPGKLSWPPGTQIQAPSAGMASYDGQMYQSDFLFEGATFIL